MPDDLTVDPVAALAGVEPGSIEEVALGVIAYGRACMASIDAAKPSALSTRLALGAGDDVAKASAWEARVGGLVDGAASAAIGFGARLIVLESMLGDLTAAASSGRAQRQRQREITAAAAAKAKERTEPLREAAAAFIREHGYSPTLSLSAVARAVAAESDRAEKDVRDAIRNLFQPRAPGSKEYTPHREVIDRDYPAP